jgi:hypothetical protein
MHDYTNGCLYRDDPPDEAQQACSKHVEVYYCNKLIENSALVGSRKMFEKFEKGIWPLYKLPSSFRFDSF